MKKCVRICLKSKKKIVYVTTWAVVFLLTEAALYAQDGTAGINEANTKVRSYFPPAINLMYAIGAVAGLIGAVKV